jgi:hypothetical protein
MENDKQVNDMNADRIKMDGMNADQKNMDGMNADQIKMDGMNAERMSADQTNADQVKNVFLSEDLLVKNIKPEIYSLPDEFEKSKKNKNLLVYGLIFLYIATIGVGAFFLTALEDQKSRRVEVNIPEFRQFNFIELLSEKKANEEKLAQLQQELTDLRTNSMKEIQKLSPENQQKAIADMNEKIKKLEDNYKHQMSEKEDSLKALQRSITGNQQENNQTVRESQSQVKKYQDLNTMQGTEIVRINTEYEATISKLKADQQVEIDHLKKENQALVDALILRYNPVFSKGEIAAAVNAKIANVNNPSLHKYDKILDNTDVLNEQSFNQLRKKIQNQKLIIDNLQRIPYTNSMPLALNSLEALSQSIISDYETIWSGLANQVDAKGSYLGSFGYAMNYLSITRHESGFVIDARNPNRMLIFIDQAYSLKNGDTAYIFKNDDKPIARISLTPDHGQIIAKVKEVLRPIKIEPFDKILLKLEVTP